MMKFGYEFVLLFRAVLRRIADASKGAAVAMLYALAFVVWCLSPGVVLLVWLVISEFLQDNPPN